MNGPNCLSSEIVNNGSLTNGKQRYKCRVCGRPFVENPQKSQMAAETKRLIDKLRLERLPLAGIVRVTGVSKRWLQYDVNAQYDPTPRKIRVSNKSNGRLTIEGDELGSFA